MKMTYSEFARDLAARLELRPGKRHTGASLMSFEVEALFHVLNASASLLEDLEAGLRDQGLPTPTVDPHGSPVACGEPSDDPKRFGIGGHYVPPHPEEWVSSSEDDPYGSPAASRELSCKGGFSAALGKDFVVGFIAPDVARDLAEDDDGLYDDPYGETEPDHAEETTIDDLRAFIRASCKVNPND